MPPVVFFLAMTRVTGGVEAVLVQTDVTRVFLRLLLSKSVSAPQNINPTCILPHQQGGEHLWAPPGHFFSIAIGQTG